MKQNTIKIEDIKVGDKVIRADGLTGKIVNSFQVSIDTPHPYMIIEYENGKQDEIDIEEILYYPSDFYLIGTTILGNKIPVEEIESRIEQNKAKIAEIKAENDLLRKQAWRLQNAMTGEYVPQRKEGE